MTRKEAMRQTMQADTLRSLGFTVEETEQLRRISMTLCRWFERECGDSNGYASYAIERDEQTDKPYQVIHPYDSNKVRRYPIADRETGARKRLLAIIAARNTRLEGEHANGRSMIGLSAYIQTDPRGVALYIIRPDDVPEGKDVDAYYTRGIAVY